MTKRIPHSMLQWIKNQRVLPFCLTILFISLVYATSASATIDLTIYGPKRLERLKGKPTLYTGTFQRCNPATEGILKVTNGGGQSTRIKAASIQINGNEVVSENEFKQQVPAIDKIIPINRTNELRVVLKSGMQDEPNAGNNKEQSFLIIEIFGKGCDDVPPAITNPEPLDGSLLNTPVPRIAAQYDDNSDGTGIDPSTVHITVDGKDVTSPAKISANGVNYTPSQNLAEGEHSVAVSVSDRAHNPASLAWRFTTDTVAPRVAITSHGNQQYINTPLITLSGTLDDPTASVTVNGGAAAVSGNGFSIANLALSEGPNTILVEAKDPAGNKSSGSIVINLDTVTPTLTVSGLLDGAYTNQSVLNVTGTVTDNAGLQGLAINGAAVEVGASGVFSRPITLTTGPNPIESRATDLAGNTTLDTRTIILDQTPPTVTINSPSPVVISNNTPLLSYALSDGLVVVKVDGIVVSKESGDTLDPLTDGPHTLRVEAADLAGNRVNAETTFTVDTVSPVVNITSPAAGLTTERAPLLVYTVTEGTAVVKVDGVVVSKVSGMTLDPLSGGEHTLRVEAVDSAGNTGFAEKTITVNTRLFGLTIHPVSLPISNNAVALSGYMEHGATITVAVDTSASIGPIVYPTSSSWSCSLSGLAMGANNITVTATNSAGNTASAMVEVDSGIIGSWHMDGDWADASGYNNNGAGYLGATFSANARSGSNAGSFDGLDDYVVASSQLLSGTPNTFTIAFWANPTTSHTKAVSEVNSGTPGTGGQRFAVAPASGGSLDAGAGVSVGTDGIRVFEHGSGYFPSLLVYNAPLSGWNYIAVVYENKQPKLYLNGQFVKAGLTSAKRFVYPSATFGNIGPYGPYKGLLDEVVIYNRALTEAEMRSAIALNQAPAVVITSPQAGLTNDAAPLLAYSHSQGTVTVKVDDAIVSTVSGGRLDRLADGTHYVRVEVVDDNGVTGFREVAVTVATKTLLTISPITTPTSIHSQTITGSRENSATVTVTVNTAASPGPVTYPTATTWSCTLIGLASGENRITVTATDAVGNVATATVSINAVLMELSNISVSRNILNTATFDSTTIFFTLTLPGTVTLKIIPEKLGPTGTPIYQTAQLCPATGAYLFSWDGKDSLGNVVPDEAYLYILSASDGTNIAGYSPDAPTGAGSVSCSQSSSLDPYKSIPLTITYGVSQPERVTLTINQSEVMYELMNSVPHVPGTYTFDWNGRSSAGKIVLGGLTAECSVASLLRENVIVTTGNTPYVTRLKTDPYDIQLSYGEYTRIAYTLSRDANITISLIPTAGSAITILNSQAQTAGTQVIEWRGLDVTDASGKEILISVEGDYLVSIQAVNPATGSSSVTKGSLRIWW